MAYLSRKEVGTWYMLCMYLLRAILAALIFFFSREMFIKKGKGFHVILIRNSNIFLKL